MTTSRSTAFTSSCLLAAVLIGMWIRRFLPEYLLSTDSRDTVKLAMGLVATMAALLLGLLVNSGKGSYDTTRSQVTHMASKFALLDRILEIYGPQATGLRAELHALIEEVTRRLWPDDVNVPEQWKPNAQMSDAFYVAVLRLEARDDTERTLKVQAVNLIQEIAELRSIMLTESTTFIARPILVVVVLWLVMIFLGYSLIAPPNALANVVLIAAALCTGGAIYLILDLERPFAGLVRISSEPMLHVLRQRGK